MGLTRNGGVVENRDNKRFAVFSVKDITEGETKKTVWVRAGAAWKNRDGSLNIYLDVLPLEGKLHVREAIEDRRQAPTFGGTNVNKANNNNDASTQPGWAAEQSMGGH